MIFRRFRERMVVLQPNKQGQIISGHVVCYSHKTGSHQGELRVRSPLSIIRGSGRAHGLDGAVRERKLGD